MSDLKSHMNSDTSLLNILTSRFSHHPERYVEIFQILRKYELHHVAAKFMLSHRHDEEEEDDGILLLNDHEFYLNNLYSIHEICISIHLYALHVDCDIDFDTCATS